MRALLEAAGIHENPMDQGHQCAGPDYSGPGAGAGPGAGEAAAAAAAAAAAVPSAAVGGEAVAGGWVAVAAGCPILPTLRKQVHFDELTGRFMCAQCFLNTRRHRR
jgi:hypothetical protein